VSPAPHFLEPLIRGTTRARLFVEGHDRPIAESIEGAFDSATRRRGLLGRDGLPEGAALVIAPSSTVHTFFMRFAIDLVFARRDGRVVKVRPRVGPWRISGARGAFAVIELPAGAAARAEVRVGDRLVVTP
jgi:uncharacterized membrane protein (UPF0127 family)